MKITIKNRFTDKIIVEAEAETLKEVVVANKANLQEANLQEADLWGADLWGAKIKITQQKDLLQSIGIEIKD